MRINVYSGANYALANCPRKAPAYPFGMAVALPLFDLRSEPASGGASDFVDIAAISSRAPIHGWVIRAHRHRKLFQILLVERGGGEMTRETDKIAFEAPCAILLPPNSAHGFRFHHDVTEGWILSVSEDAAGALAGAGAEALSHLKALASDPVVPLPAVHDRILGFAADLNAEIDLARIGCAFAARGLAALIAVEVARLAVARNRTVADVPAAATLAELRRLIDRHFPAERQLAVYAEMLGLTVRRLNEHVKRAAGVTAAQLLRQRLLIEAKRRLVFSTQQIHGIADDLGFSGPSHFARFFRRQTGETPHEYRAARGG